ncbi:MAG: DUF2752 domain-containing protein [Pyrinomonadaceae bacterium]
MTGEIFTSSTTERILAAAGVLATVGGAAFVWFFNPVNAGFFPACPLLKMTGFACPGCGLTRGFHALFHGDFLTALGFNALLPVFVFVFAYLFVAMILIAARGQSPKFHIFKPSLVWGFLILSLVFAVARNLPYYPFTLLYP